MTATTHPEFNDNTEAADVAKAFSAGIRGKAVIVTGVNQKGIGFATAEALASQDPAHLILAGRNQSKLRDCIDVLKMKFPNVDYRPLEIDLSSQQSVRAAASVLLSWADVPKVDILINSAGVMLLPERTLSEDGIEMHFATNHIGHFLFTCLIMPKFIEAAQASVKGATRIVNITSRSPMRAAMRWSDINFDKKSIELPEAERPNPDGHKLWGVVGTENMSYIPLEGYNQSKVANVLFSIAVNKRLYATHGILSLAVHPGVIKTELARNASTGITEAIETMINAGVFTYRTLGAGASTGLVAALDPSLGPGETSNGKENSGVYLADCQISDKAHPLAVSSDEAEKLWRLSEELVHQKFGW